jgi:hypothetical protein
MKRLSECMVCGCTGHGSFEDPGLPRNCLGGCRRNLVEIAVCEGCVWDLLLTVRAFVASADDTLTWQEAIGAVSALLGLPVAKRPARRAPEAVPIAVRPETAGPVANQVSSYTLPPNFAAGDLCACGHRNAEHLGPEGECDGTVRPDRSQLLPLPFTTQPQVLFCQCTGFTR